MVLVKPRRLRVVVVHDAGVSTGGVDVTGPLVCYVRAKQAPLKFTVPS